MRITLAFGALVIPALIEIEPAVAGATEQFADLNDHVLDDPRLRISFHDGRNFLKTTSRKFDVVTADPIHPWAHGSVYLYTVEYYQLAKAPIRVASISSSRAPSASGRRCGSRIFRRSMNFELQPPAS